MVGYEVGVEEWITLLESPNHHPVQQIFSGTAPWGFLSDTQIYHLVAREGERPDRPEPGSQHLIEERDWRILVDSWNADPAFRPTFGQIVSGMMAVDGPGPAQPTRQSSGPTYVPGQRSSGSLHCLGRRSLTQGRFSVTRPPSRWSSNCGCQRASCLSRSQRRSAGATTTTAGPFPLSGPSATVFSYTCSRSLVLGTIDSLSTREDCSSHWIVTDPRPLLCLQSVSHHIRPVWLRVAVHYAIPTKCFPWEICHDLEFFHRAECVSWVFDCARRWPWASDVRCCVISGWPWYVKRALAPLRRFMHRYLTLDTHCSGDYSQSNFAPPTASSSITQFHPEPIRPAGFVMETWTTDGGGGVRMPSHQHDGYLQAQSQYGSPPLTATSMGSMYSNTNTNRQELYRAPTSASSASSGSRSRFYVANPGLGGQPPISEKPPLDQRPMSVATSSSGHYQSGTPGPGAGSAWGSLPSQGALDRSMSM